MELYEKLALSHLSYPGRQSRLSEEEQAALVGHVRDFVSRLRGAPAETAKEAGLIGSAARGAWNVGKGLIAPFTGAAKGSGLGQKALHAGASTYALGSAIAPSVAPAASPPPTANIAGRSFGNGQRDNGTVRTASLDERLAKLAEGHSLLQRAGHAAPYVAWLGAQALADSHPRLSKALSAGAYLGYAGSSAHDAVTGAPGERLPGAIDALSLTAMLGADIMRWRHEGQAGHGPPPA